MTKIIKMTPDLQKKIEGFDKTDDHYKKIFTKDGIDKTELITFIEESIKLLPDEDKSDFTQHVIFHILLWGSWNLRDAMGIIECAKMDYYNTLISTMDEEDEEDDDDDN
jgi:hypothetical protein